MTRYQISKSVLKSVAYDAKSAHRNDLTMIRQIINDSIDAICRGNKLTEYQSALLANYACKLHPKQK